jgi:hypothetical protein
MDDYEAGNQYVNETVSGGLGWILIVVVVLVVLLAIAHPIVKAMAEWELWLFILAVSLVVPWLVGMRRRRSGNGPRTVLVMRVLMFIVTAMVMVVLISLANSFS